MSRNAMLFLAALPLLLLGCGDVKTTDADGGPGTDGVAPVDGAIDVVVIDAPPCPAEPCALGLACTHAAGCTSGNCECTDEACTTRVCAEAECVCGYGEDGTCASMISGGQADPEDCDGDHACFEGACKLVAGHTCTGNADCGSGQCECVDTDGTTRVCAASDCVCRYGAAGACTATMTAGAADPEDCDGTNACYAGECKKTNGQACVANSECGSGECECTNSNCTTRVCAAGTCVCKYGGDGACVNNIPNTVDDPGDCESTNMSCYAGACRAENLANGASCVDDRQCQTSNCECRDATCSQRWCAAVSCKCTYQTSSTSTTCVAAYIQSDYSDPEDCYGRTGCGLSGFDSRFCACNGSGTCIIKELVIGP